jgi:hypothetical protein
VHHGQRLVGGVGGEHAVTGLLQAERDELAQVGVVIDDEHAGHG